MLIAKSYFWVLGLVLILFFSSTLASDPKRKPAATPPIYRSPVKHVVALMFENRAFDHMLGFLKRFNPEIDGLTGDEFNLLDPLNETSQKFPIRFDAPDDLGLDPGHEINDQIEQLWGTGMVPSPLIPPLMNGFVADMHVNKKYTNPSQLGLVMRAFNTSSLPVLSKLALTNTLFDGWFSSVPGPTGPNRLYSLAATSYGESENTPFRETKGFPMRTVLEDLDDAGHSWGVYYGDFPCALQFDYVRNHPLHIHEMDTFYEHAQRGELRSFSFIEPRWFTLLENEENCEHPENPSIIQSGAVSAGEKLLAEIYNALIAAPQWNETALLIYYDEHGGLYDHVPPPLNVPNPDGRTSKNPPFNFDRLGMRVPAVVVSPWVNSGQVVHSPLNGAYFEHSSLIKTLRYLFGLRNQSLTKREAWAASFEEIFLERTEPRPSSSFPPFPVTSRSVSPADTDLHQLLSTRFADLRGAKASSPRAADYQQFLVRISDGLPIHNPHVLLNEFYTGSVEQTKTEFDSVMFVMHRLEAFLQHHPDIVEK